ncbi:uncharacterized protein C11orf97 homolog isoform X1 [Prinia subflava]|uniref:uncharacterized protein C11orf97 homolog isoform X1 n=1 Tax=Prinia subflava TaxID=208062 RepID=UPI002FE163AF
MCVPRYRGHAEWHKGAAALNDTQTCPSSRAPAVPGLAAGCTVPLEPAAAEARPRRGGPARRAAWQPRGSSPAQRPRAAAMRAAGRRVPAAAAAGEPASDARGEQPREHGRPRPPATPAPARPTPRCAPGSPADPRGSSLMSPSRAAGQKCVCVEPPRRVKEILEEHFHFQEEECNVKHPAAVALEGVWNVKNNFSIRNLKPVSQNSNDLLLQPEFYSRHTRMKNC